MTEAEARAAVVAEALTWLGTPYVSNAAIKGKHGGTDCGMILVAVYKAVCMLPEDYDPRPYPSQWHLHQDAEKYIMQLLSFAREVPEGLPGDVVIFKLGRVFSHAGIIISWPHIIHAVGNAQVIRQDLSKSTQGRRALGPAEKKFFRHKDFA